MEEEPERLSEVKGVSEKMAMAIAEQVEDKKDMRQAMMFLQNYGITINLAAKIYQEYGPALYGIIRENPYRLADDIPGVGFKMADEIAERVESSRIPITVSRQVFCTLFFWLPPTAIPIFPRQSCLPRHQSF